MLRSRDMKLRYIAIACCTIHSIAFHISDIVWGILLTVLCVDVYVCVCVCLSTPAESICVFYWNCSGRSLVTYLERVQYLACSTVWTRRADYYTRSWGLGNSTAARYFRLPNFNHKANDKFSDPSQSCLCLGSLPHGDDIKYSPSRIFFFF